MMDKKTIAAMIDHTLLKPEATPARIESCAPKRRSITLPVCVSIRFIFRWPPAC